MMISRPTHNSGQIESLACLMAVKKGLTFGFTTANKNNNDYNGELILTAFLITWKLSIILFSRMSPPPERQSTSARLSQKQGNKPTTLDLVVRLNVDHKRGSSCRLHSRHGKSGWARRLASPNHVNGHQTSWMGKQVALVPEYKERAKFKLRFG